LFQTLFLKVSAYLGDRSQDAFEGMASFSLYLIQIHLLKKRHLGGLSFWGKQRLQTGKKGERSTKCNFRLRFYGDHYPV